MDFFQQVVLSVTGALSIFSSIYNTNTAPYPNYFDNSRSDNLAVYWGQDSYGSTNPGDAAGYQHNLSYYCQDDVISAIPLAFLNVFFSTGNEPEINFANSCSSTSDPTFPGTALANCQFMASDIEACQAQGKIVTISLGGATGNAGFSSDAQGEAFAQTIWDLFLGGSSPTRPFGNAVLDGIDLDIEGGSSTGFAAFVTKLRSLMATGNKQFYVTGAPQCPFPDAYLGAVLNAVGFDAVYVQFYNNYCGNANPSAWNFDTWDNWARTTSPNPNVKIYIGAPASPSAAGSGYVDATTLGNLAKTARAKYPSFGGIMMWDASQAYGNNRYDKAVKSAMGTGSGSTTTTSHTTTTSTSHTTTHTTSTSHTTSPTKTTTSPSPSPTSCAGVSAWRSGAIYEGGSYVIYMGYLWTNKWWSSDDVPGGDAGVWVKVAACASGWRWEGSHVQHAM